MQLNLPIFHLLENADNILIAGVGDGFDILAKEDACSIVMKYMFSNRDKNRPLIIWLSEETRYDLSAIDTNAFNLR